jgi:hypothetical protein
MAGLKKKEGGSLRRLNSRATAFRQTAESTQASVSPRAGKAGSSAASFRTCARSSIWAELRIESWYHYCTFC